MKNKRCAWVGLAWAAATLAMVACSTPEPAKSPVVQGPIQSPGKRSVEVSEASTGATVLLDAAQELVVSLPVSPITGYEWSLTDAKPALLTVLGMKFERDALSPNEDSAATGAVVWRFKPAGAGTVVLNFELRRPRRLEPATKSVSYTVTVK